MKRTISCIIIGVACLAARASASEAIYHYGNLGNGSNYYSANIVGYVNGGAGFAFSPAADISVTSLGYNGGDLDYEAYQVSLWDASGSQLASATITTNNALFNQTRYESIAALTLASGNTYFMRAIGVDSGMWVGEVIVASGTEITGYFQVAPELSYLGYALGTTPFGTEPGTFPVSVNTEPLAYFIGPNFQFAVVPEPGVFSLGALSLAGLVLRRRLRS